MRRWSPAIIIFTHLPAGWIIRVYSGEIVSICAFSRDRLVAAHEGVYDASVVHEVSRSEFLDPNFTLLNHHLPDALWSKHWSKHFRPVIRSNDHTFKHFLNFVFGEPCRTLKSGSYRHSRWSPNTTIQQVRSQTAHMASVDSPLTRLFSTLVRSFKLISFYRSFLESAWRSVWRSAEFRQNGLAHKSLI